jgi:hypothetical protein
MIQEMLDIFDDDDILSQSAGETQSHDELFMTLSVVPAPRTLCLHGIIQKHPVTILVDSGSSHSFVSASLAFQLTGVQALSSELSVQVANGERFSCSTYFPQASWAVDGYDFSSDLRVLPLSSYDIILGIDWLEQFSPMKVGWRLKWLALPYKGSTILLHGAAPEAPEGTVIQVC